MQTLEPDVTDPAQVKEAVNIAQAHFGRLDVMLNNAGFPMVGTIEDGAAETSAPCKKRT